MKRVAIAATSLLALLLPGTARAAGPGEAMVRIDRIVRAGEAYDDGPRHPVVLTDEVNALLALGPERVLPAIREALELRKRDGWATGYRYAIETLAALLAGRVHDPDPPAKDWILHVRAGAVLVLARGAICTWSEPEPVPYATFADLCGEKPKLRAPLVPEGRALLDLLLSFDDLGDDDYVTRPQVWSIGIALGEAAKGDAKLAARIRKEAAGRALGPPDDHPARVLWSLSIALARLGSEEAREVLVAKLLAAAGIPDEMDCGRWFRFLGEALRAAPGGEPVLRGVRERIARSADRTALPWFDRWIGGDATVLPPLEAAEAKPTPEARRALVTARAEIGSWPGPETTLRILRLCDRTGDEALAREALWIHEPPPDPLAFVRRLLADLDAGRISVGATQDLFDPPIYASDPLCAGKDSGTLAAKRRGDRVEVTVVNRTDRPFSLNPLLARYPSWDEDESEGRVEITLGYPTPFLRVSVPAASLIVLAPGEKHTFTVALPEKTPSPLRVGICDFFEVDGDPPAPRLEGAPLVTVE